jgi:hypothetical protein
MGGIPLVVASLLFVGAAPANAGEDDTIYALVNEARWSEGQAGLVRSSELDAVAAEWAAHMAASGALEHNPNLSSNLPGGWSAAAENIAQGHANGSAMHAGWMESSGHRANVLGDFTDIGIAFVESGGTTWGVEVFGKYPGHVGPAPPAPEGPDPVPPPNDPVAPEPTTTVPSAASSPTPSASSEPTESSRPAAGATNDEPSNVVVTWIIVVAAVFAVAAVLGLLFLTSRAARSAQEPPASQDPRTPSDES